MSGGRRVLLVEDDPDDAALIQTHLRAAGVSQEIMIARDGQEALDELLRRPAEQLPLLVVTDVKMPRMSGLELLCRLKGEPSLASLPVVVLTSSDDARDRAEAQRCGAELYLRKPMRYEQFAEVARRIKEHLGGPP